MLTREDFTENELKLIDKVNEIRKDALLFEKNLSIFFDGFDFPEYISRITGHLDMYALECIGAIHSYKKEINFDDYMHWFWKYKEDYKDLDLIGFLDFYGRD